MLFLQILGVIFLIVLALGGVFFFRCIYPISKYDYNCEAYEFEESLREKQAQTLCAAETLNPSQPQSFYSLRRTVEDTGAVSIGDFTVKGTRDRALSGYALSQPPADIYVYDDAEQGNWIEIKTLFEDGTSFTASTVGEEHQDGVRHPDMPMTYFHAQTPVTKILATIETQLEYKSAINNSPEEFQQRHAAAEAKAIEYFHTAQLSQAELNQLGKAQGFEFSELDVEHINHIRAASAQVNLVSEIIQSFLTSHPFTALQWEKIRDDVRVVHEQQDSEDAGEAFHHLWNVNEFEDQVDELGERNDPIRSLVHEFNESLPTRYALQKIGSVTTPVNADLYIRVSTTLD